MKNQKGYTLIELLVILGFIVFIFVVLICSGIIAQFIFNKL